MCHFPLFEKATRDNAPLRSLGDKLQSAFQAIVLPYPYSYLSMLWRLSRATERFAVSQGYSISQIPEGGLTERAPERPVLVAQLPDDLDVTFRQVVHARREFDRRSRQSRSRGCFD